MPLVIKCDSCGHQWEQLTDFPQTCRECGHSISTGTVDTSTYFQVSLSFPRAY